MTLETRCPLSLAASRVALAALLLASGANAQERMNLVEGREVLDFARGLASEFSFVDLAAEVLAEGERRGFPASMKEQVAIEKCNVFAIGALSTREPERRHQLYEEALQAYTDFIDQNSRSEALPEAEAGFVEASAQYAQSMLAALEDAKGEEAERLRQRRIEVLTDAVSRTGNLIEKLRSLEEPREADRRRLYELMLNRGRMLTETARSQEDPSFSFEQANIVLEELTFEAGEGSPYALRAFDAMGDNLAAQGRPEEAAYMYTYVVDTAIPMDAERWAQMVQEQQLVKADVETRWLFVELSTRGLVESWAEAGDLQAALQGAMHFYNTYKREGVNLSVSGYLSMLQVGRTLLDAGGYVGGNVAQGTLEWFPTEDDMKAAGHTSSRNQRTASDLALTIAQQVKDDNRGNTLQVRAQKLIKAVISQPGVKKSPDVLRDAALGEYNQQNWGEAIQGFKDVLDAVAQEDDATQTRFAPEILYYLGRSYRGDGRNLEAALCFQEAITTYKGDEGQNNDNAKGFMAAIREVSSSLRGEDDQIAALVREAEQAVIKYADEGGADAILWRRAEKARDEKNYDEAVSLYQQITAGSNYHEKALVNVGVSKLRAGDADAALAIFDDYLGNFVNDPKNAIAQSEVKLTRRREAMASAEFYRGYIYFKRAEDKPASDPNWKLVVDNLSSYYLDYPEQEKLSPATMRMVAESHLALSETADARKVLDAMLERFADSQFTGRVSIEVYKKLKDDHDAAEQAGDDERAMALLREMAELLHSANATAATPSFDNLRNESRHWMDLREWKKAEAVLDTLRAKFSDSNTEDMVKYVLPDLGESYLRQKRVNDALEVLAPLNAEGAKPSKDVAVNYCKAVLGWVEEDEVGRITIVPGAAMQDPALVEDAVDKKLSPIEKSTESWSAEWCVAYFDYLYGYYVWSEINSVKLDTLKTFLSKMVTLMGGDRQFGEIENVVSKAEDEALVARYGQDVLRKRYVWLFQKVGL